MSLRDALDRFDTVTEATRLRMTLSGCDPREVIEYIDSREDQRAVIVREWEEEIVWRS